MLRNARFPFLVLIGFLLIFSACGKRKDGWTDERYDRHRDACERAFRRFEKSEKFCGCYFDKIASNLTYDEFRGTQSDQADTDNNARQILEFLRECARKHDIVND